MIEFWALIGLACLDKVFLKELTANKNNLEPVVRNYGFRLSRWEMGELTRVMQLPKVVGHMGMICDDAWDNAFNPIDLAPCWWSAYTSAQFDDPNAASYVHPLENGGPVPKARGNDGLNKALAS